MGSLVGILKNTQGLTGKVNNKEVPLYPELENLEVIPSAEEQKFKSNMYGYNEVTVKAIETEELNVTPNTSEQNFDGLYSKVNVEAISGEEINIVPSTEEQVKEGLFSKVTVAGDSNLIPENIKSGVGLFGVDGNYTGADIKITDARYLFYYGARRDMINELLNICKNVTNTQSMFGYNDKITTLDLSNFDTSNVTNMEGMFTGCDSLLNLNINNFNTSNVTNMVNMFKYCRNLQELNLKSFDTSNVTKIYSMFEECNKIISLDLSNFNTSNITSMSKMFYRLYNVTNINVSTFDTSKVTDMSSMFSQCRILENLDISNFDASSVNYVSSMFYNLPKLINLKFMSNLGKGYTQKSTNYSNYKLDLSLSKNLTHESLMNVINNLYDLNLSYDVANGGTLYTQGLVLGSTNLAKLTADEIAIATNKGWTVS